MFGITHEMKGSQQGQNIFDRSGENKTTSDPVMNAIAASVASVFVPPKLPDGQTPSDMTKAFLSGRQISYSNEQLKEDWGSVTQPISLPFTAAEQAVCKRVFTGSFFNAGELTFMDLLGMQIYRNLQLLVEKVEDLEKKSALKGFVDDFCRAWLLVYLSAGANMSGNMQESFTVEEFTTSIEHISMQLVSSLSQNEKKQDAYKNVVSFMKLIVKSWQAENTDFLHASGSGQVSQFILWLPPEQADSDVLYAECMLFINFIECAYKQTGFLNSSKRDESIRSLGGLKKHLLNIKEKISPLKEALESSSKEGLEVSHFVAGIQKQLLKDMKELLNKNCENQKCKESSQWRAVMNSKKNCLTISKTGKNNASYIMNGMRHTFYTVFFENIASFLDDYIASSFRSHVTLSSILRRVLLLNITLHRACNIYNNTSDAGGLVVNVDIAKVRIREKLEQAKIDFLSEEEQEFFESKIISFSQELETHFRPNPEMYSILHKLQGLEHSLKMRNLRAIEDHEINYPMFKKWLEDLYKQLEKMLSSHGQQLALFIERLSEETCRTHKKEILEFFEDLLIQQMVPFCVVYMIHQDLYFLTQDQNAEELVPFFKTPIAQYIFMQEIEDAVLKKIGETVEEFDVSSESVSSESEGDVEIATEEASGGPTELSLSEECETKRAPAQQVNPPVIHVRENQHPQPKPAIDKPFRFKIRRGEKARRVLKKLSALGLDLRNITGSHYQMRGKGGSCTVAFHGSNPPLTATVRSGLTKQVRKIMGRRAEGKE